MKFKALFCSFTFVFLSSSAFAEMLLSYEKTSGFVPNDKQYRMHCEIFANAESYDVRVFYRKALDQPQYKYYTTFINHDVKDLIQQAGEVEITAIQAPADIGNSIFTSYKQIATGKTLVVDLGSMRDGYQETINPSEAASELKNILLDLCHLLNVLNI